MRSALIAFVLVAGIVLALSLPRAVSNADFAYMCAGAAMVADGKLPATPYFPPGYPALLLSLMLTGLSALYAGYVWSAIGTALSAAAVAYLARVWGVPPAPALLLALLAASLPSVFIVAMNPHVDALFTGLGAVLLAAALRALAARPGAWVYLAVLLCSLLLISLRWHAWLLVFPIALVLAFSRAPGVRALGLTALALALLAVGAAFYALHEASGTLRTAAAVQVATGAEYRAAPSEEAAVATLYDDYPAWLARVPQVTPLLALDGIRANWPRFLLLRPVLAGTALWLLALVAMRRQQPGAHWLLACIAGYTLAISPAYFTDRAAALPVIAGAMLGTAGLATLLFTRPVARPRRGRAQARPARQQRGQELPPYAAVCGVLVALACIVGLGYDTWRELPALRAQHGLRLQVAAANRQALILAGGNRRRLYGPLDFTGIYQGRYSLPAATWSRLWMDDPDVAGQLDPYIPRIPAADVAAAAGAGAQVRAVMLWPGHTSPTSRWLLEELPRSAAWDEVPAEVDGVRIWVRR